MTSSVTLNAVRLTLLPTISSTASTAYPSLPIVTIGYSPHSTHSIAAPTSTLGTNFDSDLRRRYSGDELRTPSPKETTPLLESIVKSTLASNIDPALSGAISPSLQSEDGDNARDHVEELWIENIRVIKALRKLVNDRLERGEYIEDKDTDMSGTSESKSSPSPVEKSTESLYPVLRFDDD
ncbi:hypothetical protein G7Y89_g7006 [Cudoniella acicularis]|uniref:Uncharacterized protein n=1 Tax=Cudoniella acicularis TaxID=354080 RepID=A0A8H4RLY1_9HELO|nr:hypothetical protein G7Y89_g7006 [Cudoniella acicularis]